MIRPTVALSATSTVVACAMLASCDRNEQQAPASRPPAPVSESARHSESRTLEGGLAILDLIAGQGPEATPTSLVEIEYEARFASGEVWDSSEKRTRTLTFALDSPGLIEGLRRGIVGMRLGGSRRLDIPYTLAYGETGRDPVPPRTDLIYEITLIAIHDSSTARDESEAQ